MVFPYILDYPSYDLLDNCPPKRSCLESRKTSVSHCPMSVAEQSTEVIVGGLTSVDSRRGDECIADTNASTACLDHFFTSGAPLCPVELLMYSLMKIQFKTYTFSRHHTITQYNGIIEALFRVCGIHFKASSVRRFFPRISKNELRATVGKDNGKVRWNCYRSKVEEFIRISGTEQLERILKFPGAITEEVIVAISANLKDICSNSTPTEVIIYRQSILFPNLITSLENIYLKILLRYHGLMKKTERSICFNLAVLQDMQRRKYGFLKCLNGNSTSVT